MGRRRAWAARLLEVGAAFLVCSPEPVHPGVHHGDHGSQPVSCLHLNSNIFRDMYLGGGPRGEWEPAVLPTVVLEPVCHALRLSPRFKREVPIQGNYFSLFHAVMADLLGGQRAVPVIQFNGYKGGASTRGGWQGHILATPKINVIVKVRTFLLGGFRSRFERALQWSDLFSPHPVVAP